MLHTARSAVYIFPIIFPNCCTERYGFQPFCKFTSVDRSHCICSMLIIFSPWDIDVTDPDPVQELIYDLRSQCDAIRVTKTVRPFSMVCCPVNENSAALIVSDGRVMIWELKSSISGRNVRNR